MPAIISIKGHLGGVDRLLSRVTGLVGDVLRVRPIAAGTLLLAAAEHAEGDRVQDACVQTMVRLAL